MVIRDADGTFKEHELDEQALLDFLTCGAPVGYHLATLGEADLLSRPGPHHTRWVETDLVAYEGSSGG